MLRSRGGRLTVLLAQALALLASAGPAVGQSIDVAWPLASGLHVHRVHAQSAAALPSIAALQSPPIGGALTLVAFGLTNERSPNKFEFFASPSTSPGGSSLPIGQPAYYDIALLDTGANLHLFRHDTMQVFNLAAAGRQGIHPINISGVAGSETGLISDALGVYATGLGSITAIDPIALSPGALRGQTHVAVVTGQQGSLLPNVIGMPMAYHHDPVIHANRPQIVRVDGQTYRSPLVELVAQGTAPTQPFRAFMSTEGSVGDGVVLFPGDFSDFGNDPILPSISDQLYLTVDIARDGNSRVDLSMLLDTGAQVSVISQQRAVQMGFDPDSDTPAFTVDITGAGGTLHDVPGIFLDSLKIQGTGGTFQPTQVPVIVLDVTDPRTGGTLDGLIGTNLFVDRTLSFNRTGGRLGISAPLRSIWSLDASGDWSIAGNWTNGAMNGPGGWAALLNANSGPVTVALDTDITLGILEFDSPHSYHVGAPGGTHSLTLATTAGAALVRASNVNGQGDHAIHAPVTLASNVNLDSFDDTSLELAGTLNNTAGHRMWKYGGGQVLFAGAQMHGAGARLEIYEGTVVLAGNAGAGGANLAVQVLDVGRLALSGHQQLASLANQADVALGGAPGVAAIAGGYTQSASATLQVDLGDTGAGLGHSQLAVGAAAELSGTLRLQLTGGFVPNPTDTFTVLTYGQREGWFTDVQGLQISPTQTFALHVNDDRLLAIAGQWHDGGDLSGWLQAPGDLAITGAASLSDLLYVSGGGQVNVNTTLAAAPGARLILGSTSAATSATLLVPEPASLTLALLALLLVTKLRAFHRRVEPAGLDAKCSCPLRETGAASEGRVR